jgi:hypothetical protein
LFKESWAGIKLREHYHRALPLLDQLYGIRHINLKQEDGSKETFLFVRPSAIMEAAPCHHLVTRAGDGWLEAGGRRYEGWVYIAAGVWCEPFLPGLGVFGKAGSSFLFAGEREGSIRSLGHGGQAVAFVRDPGTTFFSDGTAEREYTEEHDRHTLLRAGSVGLNETPIRRFWGRRPYVPGGPVFRKISNRTWLATGGRKMGTILAASFANRLVEDELG